MGQTATIRTNQASNHKLVGDIVNIFVLVATFAHLSTVIYFTLPGAQGVVDEHWKKDGFCIQNIDNLTQKNNAAIQHYKSASCRAG